MSKCRPPEAERQAPLSDGVEKALEERIISGKWKVGFKLPSEGKLCDEFGVSRTAVREALRELRGRGVIETLNGSGSYVSGGNLDMVSRAMSAYSRLTVDSKPALDLIDFRGVIEGAALLRLSRRSNKVTLSKLSHLLEKMKAEDRIGRFMKICAKFHITILESYKNEFISTMGQSMYQKYIVGAKDNHIMDEILHCEAVAEHSALVNAIESRDSDAALLALENHLTAAKRREKILFSEN